MRGTRGMFTRIPGNLLEDSGECYYFNIPGNVEEDSRTKIESKDIYSSVIKSVRQSLSRHHMSMRMCKYNSLFYFIEK